MKKTSKTRNQAASKAMSIPAPTEDSWGFYGTIISDGWTEDNKVPIGHPEAERIWQVACQAVAEKYGEANPAVVRNFLRAPVGRHFADAVYNHATAVTEQALIAAIPAAINETNNKGRNTWMQSFEEVKKATESGAWLD
jgi:hypothetical protein